MRYGRKMREGDDFGDLDLIEAVGTLELALYVPVPLHWNAGTKKRRGHQDGAHSPRGQLEIHSLT